MKAVNIAELKNQLSRYLRMVRSGETILVRDRERIVARIEACGPGDGALEGDELALEDLEKRGILRRRTTPITEEILNRRLRVDADVVAALLAEREHGR